MNVAEKTNDILKAIKLLGWKNYKAQITRECVWHPEYAIFIIDFIIPGFLGFHDEYDDNEYVTPPKFDKRQFYDDFISFLKKELPDCNITYWPQIREIEICGPNYKQFYQDNLDELEYISEQNDKYYYWSGPGVT